MDRGWVEREQHTGPAGGGVGGAMRNLEAMGRISGLLMSMTASFLLK